VGTARRIEFFWWRGCPSWERALAELRDVVAAVGLDPDSIEVREILDEDDAAREGFPGSPTIRVDGLDVLPPGSAEPLGLTCRVYRLRDGRFSPTPDPEDLKQAFEQLEVGR
jgi:hypothetical protein